MARTRLGLHGSASAYLGFVAKDAAAILAADAIIVAIAAYDRTVGIAAHDRTVAIDAYDRTILIPDVRGDL